VVLACCVDTGVHKVWQFLQQDKKSGGTSDGAALRHLEGGSSNPQKEQLWVLADGFPQLEAR